MSEEKQQYEEVAPLAEDLNGDPHGDEQPEEPQYEQAVAEEPQAEQAIAEEPQAEQAIAEEPQAEQAIDEEPLDERAIAEILAEDQLIEDEFLSAGDADEDEEQNGVIASAAPYDSASEFRTESLNGTSVDSSGASDDDIRATRDELKPVIEALLFVADEPLPFKQLCKILGDAPEEDVMSALSELVADYESRGSGLEAREIAGGWRISTRPQHHEFIRKYLKSRPSARLSLPALETLAVIAYKQPITIPEILEIRGVTSSSAIKTLLEKRLIVTRGRKETVGRPMMYGTSKEFLIQFGLKDLTELPSIEDFEDFAQ